MTFMLNQKTLDANPYRLFDEWLNDAINHDAIGEPTAMALATANQIGEVSCRMVLLKEHSTQGFVFYTNHATSRKSADIQSNPHASLCFYWQPLDRQIRIEGRVERVSDEQADAYFNSRSRGSQIGAWASAQTLALDSRATLEERINAMEMKYAGRDIPRPEHWHGWRVLPNRMEFWHQRDFRLHDRFEYVMNEADGEWHVQRLNP